MKMIVSLPRNYVEIEKEEMQYLDGGSIYIGGRELGRRYNLRNKKLHIKDI